MKFRKKPVEIEAWQFNGENGLHWPNWIHNYDRDGKVVFWSNENILTIPTLEGQMFASKGDWIIKGIKGEIYPCKPDIFDMTYEKID